jgi:hypothetical protein
MSAETLQHAWEWLLSLSKIQLILLGGVVSLLVAVSKVLRFLFLLGLLVVFLIALLPELAKRYEHIPLPTIVKELVHKGVEATKDQVPTQQKPGKE